MNSPNNSTVPSRRFKWLRRFFWTVVCLASLLALYYQWENRRSARELAGAHRRVVERLGTDDPRAFMPPKITNEENYFANPVLESWLRQKKPGSAKLWYDPPHDALLPKDFSQPEIIESDDGSPGRLDLKSWMAKHNLPSSEDPVILLARELSDGNGLLPRLAEGLNKPFSIMKPGQQQALEAVGGNPWEATIPEFRDLNGFQRQLGLHLRSAALAGDGDKTTTVAHVMLRFGEAPARSGIIGCLVPLALHQIAFDALHEALEHPVWTEEALGRLQVRLGQFDELEQYQKAFGGEVLGMLGMLAYLRSHAEALDDIFPESQAPQWWQRVLERAFDFGMKHGPIGWHDANIAFYADCMLEQLGPQEPDAWLSAPARDANVLRRSKEANSGPNPRRILGAIAIPKIGNISRAAAETLFHRRCLIIACALEKHRLRHGAYPPSLEAVKDDLKLYTPDDPARPEHPPGYRLEKDGYLLWSAGPDAQDDGGAKEKDWLWRLKRAP